MSDKIKSITTFRVDDGRGNPEVKSQYEERDPQGNILVLAQYMTNGRVESKSVRTYDDKGRIVTEMHYSDSEKPDQELEYQYNESGKVGQIIVLYADGSKTFKKFSRDEAAHSTTIDLIDDDGDAEGKEFRRFDDENNLLEEVIYDESGAIQEKAEYEFDEHNNVVESVSVDAEAYETVLFYDYHRDDKGRISKLETLNEDEEIIREDEFVFDERGNRTKRIMQDKSRGFFITDEWDYNLDNLVTQQRRLRGEKLAEEINFKYRADNLLEEQEVLNQDGTYLNIFHYEFH